MSRSRSRSRSRTGVRSDASFCSRTSPPSSTDYQSFGLPSQPSQLHHLTQHFATDHLRNLRYSSRLMEPAAFIELKVSIGEYSTPRSVYLRNDPSTTVLDVKATIYDEIDRIPLKYQQLFFLDPTRIARNESAIIAIEPLDFWQPLAFYGITDGAEIRCVKWCEICWEKLCVCPSLFTWRDVLYSGSRLTFDDLGGLGDEIFDLL